MVWDVVDYGFYECVCGLGLCGDDVGVDDGLVGDVCFGVG